MKLRYHFWIFVSEIFFFTEVFFQIKKKNLCCLWRLLCSGFVWAISRVTSRALAESLPALHGTSSKGILPVKQPLFFRAKGLTYQRHQYDARKAMRPR